MSNFARMAAEEMGYAPKQEVTSTPDTEYDFVSEGQTEDQMVVKALELGLPASTMARYLEVGMPTFRSLVAVYDIKPVGKTPKRGHPLYSLKDMVPLVRPPPVDQIERWLSKASHHDLPPLLTKAYWDGLRSRQKYEEESGMVWPTELVLQGIGMMTKLVRMMLLTLPDELHRQNPLTREQRKLVEDLCHNTLVSMQKAVKETFQDEPDEPDSTSRVRGAPDEPGPDDAVSGQGDADEPLDPAWDI